MDKDLTKKSSYNYYLPEELIAQYPLQKRDESRLLCLDKNTGNIEHHIFSDLPNLLRKDDILVLNKTKVIPARLKGKKSNGVNVEIFLLNRIEDNVWECLVKPGRRLKPDTDVYFTENFSAKIIDYADEGARLVKFYYSGDFWKAINDIGKIPLPPYIKRDVIDEDKNTYQTVYAQVKGSVAAPTAGLHFTKKILNKLDEKGIRILDVILHVGLGTFRPVKTENILNHNMHTEYCEVSHETADIINKAKSNGQRIIAVGTTTTRTLESFAENGKLNHGSHFTDIFIFPGKKLQIIDGLITNFHMPESTLMMLVSAFAGYDNIMNAYKIAVEKQYRFFSYGDAMLIL